MTSAGLVLLLALPCAAAPLGGHEDPKAESAAPAPADDRRATLEEMWLRRLLPPDQNGWAPRDLEILRRIRAVEGDALAYFKRRPQERGWSVRTRFGAARLTKDGYERYEFLLTQDAIRFFESKGADAKRVFKLRDMDGRELFDASGRLTDDGARLYRRASLNLEAFWKDPEGGTFGTRRPQASQPPAR